MDRLVLGVHVGPLQSQEFTWTSPTIETIRFKNEDVIADAIGTVHSMAERCLRKLNREQELFSLEQFELEIERDVCERFGLPLPMME